MYVIFQMRNCGSLIRNDRFNKIADRQYANWISVPENRKVPHASASHESHAFFDCVSRAYVWNRRLHDTSHAGSPGSFTVEENAARASSLRDNAHQPRVYNHEKRPYVALHHDHQRIADASV